MPFIQWVIATHNIRQESTGFGKPDFHEVISINTKQPLKTNKRRNNESA
jgi:hypothetical protein